MIELKKRLMNNPYHIENILEEYDFHNIDVGTREIRCGINEKSNITSIRIKLNENLTANDFVRDIHGDLFSLIMKCKNVELKHIIKTVKEELGITYIEFQKTKKIFGGFYDKIKRRNQTGTELKKYDESIMNEYLNKYNTLFFRDGISFATQKKFKIGLDHVSSRISVPWYDFEESLIGIEGRYTGDYEKDEVSKWYPIIPFPKSQALFGYNVNYMDLQGADEIYIGESSKFVMQLDSMGIHTAVALGGKTIHNQQIKQLTWLNPKKIIFCFDEGLDEELIHRQVEKTKILLKFFDIEIGYVNDKNNILLEKCSKNSPSDIGKDGFKELIKNYVEWESSI
jgi:DNA primase